MSPVWKAALENYDLIDIIGEGSYGEVMEAKCKVTGERVAIKYVKNIYENEYDWVKTLREIQIMRKLSAIPGNRLTTKLIDLFNPRKQDSTKGGLGIFIVMEYMQTDLKELLNLTASTKITEGHAIQIIYNLLCAVKFIHSANIIHRDLKPANILIDQNCNIKLCDFGLARTLPESCLGQGSGNTKRMRDSILKSKLNS